MAFSSDPEDEILLIATILCEEEENENAKKKPRLWVHPINEKRSHFGEFHHLYSDLEKDPKKYFQYFRMTQTKFNELLGIIHHHLSFKDTSFRRAVTPEERLAVCLRFLSTGDSFKTIANSYRLGETTVRNIVYSTCKGIWQELRLKVMPEPTKEHWKRIEERFRIQWNYPNCCGAIDGKHVVTDKPSNSGSLFFNYKHTFSVVLLALVDADYKFVSISVGGYGKDSDAGIFAKSMLGKKLTAGILNLPDDSPLPGFTELVPHVIIGDEGFPLQERLMRPYPRKQVQCSLSKRVYNYRHSRARRVVENCFGILTKRFRVYQRTLQIAPEHIDVVVGATCCLHNFLRSDTCFWTEDEEDGDNLNAGSLQTIHRIGGNATDRAVAVRDLFKDYFNSEAGSIPWQMKMVTP